MESTVMTRRPKSVRQLLKSKPTLKQLELEISAQKALLLDVHRHLPKELVPHCIAAQQQDDRLVLHCDSPVWATRLRYIAPQLLSLLQARRKSLREIKIRLFINNQKQPVRAKFRAHHSDVAADIVRSGAADFEQGPLRQAMLRLSRALKR
jgi:hypothetical protein